MAPAAGVGSGEVRLAWTAPADGGAAITDYVIERSVDGISWTTVNDGASTATAFTVGGLTNGTRYSFRVAARNAVGLGPSSAVVMATPVWKPAAPAGLRAAVAPASGVGSGQVRLSWTAPSSTGGTRLTDYVIQRSTDGATWTTLNDGATTATTVTVGRLTNGTAYRFRVAARNAVGIGAWSRTVVAKPVWRPTAPTRLSAAVAPAGGVGSGMVKLTWNAPTSTGGTPVTDYVLQRSRNGTKWTTVRDGVSIRRSHLVARLTNDSPYRFRVAARNRVGTGQWSAIVRATPRDR